MAYNSPIQSDEFVIDDATPVPEPPPGMSRGLDLSGRPEGFAYGGLADQFPSNLIVPKSEWQARIQEMDERKARLSDLSDQAGLRCLDQNGTSYCWINGPTYGVEVVRVVQNQPLVYLSPASAGAPIKNFRNVGGWGKEGLEYIIEHGLVPVDKWPANAIDRRYYTAENRELAKQYRVTEWWELRPRNTEQLISCLLRRVPVAVGYNWWVHEVCAIDAVWKDGTACIRIRNSWGMNWGDRGYSILQGNRMLPDDAVAPRVATAS